RRHKLNNLARGTISPTPRQRAHTAPRQGQRRGQVSMWPQLPSSRLNHRGLAVSVEELPENLERLGRFMHNLYGRDNIAMLQAKPPYHLRREVELPFVLRTHLQSS